MTVDRPAQSREKGFTALTRLLPRPPKTPCSQAYSLAKPPKESWKGWVQWCFFLQGMAKALSSALRFIPFLPVSAAPSLCTGTQLWQISAHKTLHGPHLGLSHVGSFFSDRSFFHPVSEYCEILRLHRKSADKKAINSVKVRNRSSKTASLFC